MDKAKRLAAEWNLDTTVGNYDFSILDIYSDSILSSMIMDSRIVFVPSAGSPGRLSPFLGQKKKSKRLWQRWLTTRRGRWCESSAAREAAPMPAPIP
jgi:hypothetical protein